jgi:hypothetical protein
MRLDRCIVDPRVVVVIFFAATLIFVQFLSAAAFAQEQKNAFPGIGDGLERIRFHTGKVADNQPQISRILPEIPGPPSHWSLLQWAQGQVILPTNLVIDDPATRDAHFGLAKYAFSASDGHSHMWIYRDPASNHPVYELYEQGGALTTAGGANVFLASDGPPGGISLEHELIYEIDTKLSRASVNATVAAQKSGVVLAQVFSGFVIHFPEPDGKTISTLFLQLPIARSIPSPNEYRSCTMENGRHNIIFGALAEPTTSLPFAVDEGPLRHLRFDINSYICKLISRPLICTASTSEKTSWQLPASATGFHDWKIVNMYVGLETETQDLRAQSATKESQGQVEVALQLADLKVVTPATLKDFKPADCTQPISTPTRP